MSTQLVLPILVICLNASLVRALETPAAPVRNILFVAQASDFADNNSLVWNSSGSFVQTSPFARLVFRTDARSITIHFNYNACAAFGSDTYSFQLGQLGVRVNGSDYQGIAPTQCDANQATVSLPAETNTVEIVQGPQPGAINGTFVQSVQFWSATRADLVSPPSSPRLSVYGDSISVGYFADAPAFQAWDVLLRQALPGSVLLESFGGRQLGNDCATPAVCDAFVSHLKNASPTSLWIAIGTNDYGVNTESAAAFGSLYAMLLDKAHTAMPQLKIYAQSPIARDVETANGLGNTLDDYRQQIQMVASARPWVRFVDGKSLLTLYGPDYSPDELHPSTQGHAKYEHFVLGLVSAQGATAPSPTADSVTPSSGSALTQSFSFIYNDALGANNLNMAYALFNSSLNGANACYVFYRPASNGLYLVPDAGGTPYLGPVTPGSASSISNSQCTLSGSNSTVSLIGTTLTMNLALSFTPRLGGSNSIFMYAANKQGLVSGWQPRGVWSLAVNNPSPTADSVTPDVGSGTNQTFSFAFSDSLGASNLNVVYAVVNSVVSAARSCLVGYLPNSNVLYLYNDAGDALLGPLTPGAANNLSNGQCALSGPGTSANLAGDSLTLVLPLTFTPSFGGAKSIFMYAADNQALASGWQTRGSWTSPITNSPPTADTVTPSSGSVASQTLSFAYSDQLGASNLNVVYALFNSALSAANSCLVGYLASSHVFYLYNDAGDALLGPLTPGSASNISNSQCTLSGIGTSISLSTNTLTMNLALTFSSAFMGIKTIFMYASDYQGLASGWQSRGTWTVPSGGVTMPAAQSSGWNAFTRRLRSR